MFCLNKFEFYVFSCPLLRLPICCIRPVRTCWEWVQVLLIIIPGRETWTGPVPGKLGPVRTFFAHLLWLVDGNSHRSGDSWYWELRREQILHSVCFGTTMISQGVRESSNFLLVQRTWPQGMFSLCFLPREDPWEDTRPAGTLISDFPVPRTVRKVNVFCLSHPTYGILL